MINHTNLLINTVLVMAYLNKPIFAASQQNIKILFPTSFKIEWHDVSSSNLKCPNTNVHQNIDHGTSFIVHRPHIGKDPMISGTLCVSMELITTCSKGFFGGLDIMTSTSPADLSEEDCRKEIARQNQGEFSSSEHPQPVCSWMKTSSTSRTVIHLNNMDVHYDPYSERLCLSLFIGGKFRIPGVDIVFENRLWVPHESLTKYCSEEHLVESSLIIYNTTATKSALWSPDFDVAEDELPCIMSFCGQRGLRFGSGEWVAYPGRMFLLEPWVGEYFYHLQFCDSHTTINLVEANQDLKHMTKEVLTEFLDEQCEMTINKLKEGNLISRIELQTMYPRTPGFHPVYRYTPGKFLMGMAHYSWVSIEPSDIFPYVLIRSSLNKTIEYPYWTLDNRTNIIDGPNGLYILDRTLIYGLEEEQTFKRTLSKSSLHIFPIVSEQKNITKSFLKLISHKSYSFSDDASLVDVIWHPTLKYAITTSLIIAILLILICCARRQIFIKRCKYCVKTDARRPDDLSEEEGDYFDP
ncbi:glycoprotein [North Creek virus]|uniref:Glycoprotein n=1 Tax=North Creek virus TaxID=1406950 RepID=U5S5P5_9RHAB|nr:glycoprotein [North Creek virus]AGY80342.1 glycoprotein [North Creek virus]